MHAVATPRDAAERRAARVDVEHLGQQEVVPAGDVQHRDAQVFEPRGRVEVVPETLAGRVLHDQRPQPARLAVDRLERLGQRQVPVQLGPGKLLPARAAHLRRAHHQAPGQRPVQQQGPVAVEEPVQVGRPHHVDHRLDAHPGRRGGRGQPETGVAGDRQAHQCGAPVAPVAAAQPGQRVVAVVALARQLELALRLVAPAAVLQDDRVAAGAEAHRQELHERRVAAVGRAHHHHRGRRRAHREVDVGGQRDAVAGRDRDPGEDARARAGRFQACPLRECRQ